MNPGAHGSAPHAGPGSAAPLSPLTLQFMAKDSVRESVSRASENLSSSSSPSPSLSRLRSTAVTETASCFLVSFVASTGTATSRDAAAAATVAREPQSAPPRNARRSRSARASWYGVPPPPPPPPPPASSGRGARASSRGGVGGAARRVRTLLGWPGRCSQTKGTAPGRRKGPDLRSGLYAGGALRSIRWAPVPPRAPIARSARIASPRPRSAGSERARETREKGAPRRFGRRERAGWGEPASVGSER
ncbi:unnamed protein product [Urochloa humidicola]